MNSIKRAAAPYRTPAERIAQGWRATVDEAGGMVPGLLAAFALGSLDRLFFEQKNEIVSAGVMDGSILDRYREFAQLFGVPGESPRGTPAENNSTLAPGAAEQPKGRRLNGTQALFDVAMLVPLFRSWDRAHQIDKQRGDGRRSEVGWVMGRNLGTVVGFLGTSFASTKVLPETTLATRFGVALVGSYIGNLLGRRCFGGRFFKTPSAGNTAPQPRVEEAPPSQLPGLEGLPFSF